MLAAHLLAPRRLYTHHGLYVGGNRVIHYAGLSEGLHGGSVEEVSLECFAGGRGIRVRVEAARFDREEVLQRARRRLGERRYRVLSNNCEHFCEWCLRGESRSTQVESLCPWLRRCGPLTGFLQLLITARQRARRRPELSGVSSASGLSLG